MTSTVLIASLFTLFGVILSVTANFITQQRQHEAAIRKARFDILGIYAQKLEDERLERYPALYALLSFGEELAYPLDRSRVQQVGVLGKLGPSGAWSDLQERLDGDGGSFPFGIDRPDQGSEAGITKDAAHYGVSLPRWRLAA